MMIILVICYRITAIQINEYGTKWCSVKQLTNIPEYAD